MNLKTRYLGRSLSEPGCFPLCRRAEGTHRIAGVSAFDRVCDVKPLGVRSDGANRPLRETQLQVPDVAAGSVSVPEHPCPARDEFSIRDSRQSRRRGRDEEKPR